MAKKFIVRHRDIMPKEDKSVTMSLRLDRSLQEEYDQLALKSGRSRNELMCRALRFAMDNLEFIDSPKAAASGQDTTSSEQD